MQTSRTIILMELWAGLNWHPFQEGLQGFYVGPGVALLGGGVDSVLGVFLGVTFGYQFVLTPHLNLDLAIGLGAGSLGGTVGALPRAQIAMGYRF
jgi:hypothetical protein